MGKAGPLDLKVEWDCEGIVRSRPNRFLAVVDIAEEDGGLLVGEKVHVHDPGRLKEILFPGNRVRVKRARQGKRKTKWDLVAGISHGHWVLVNSSFHRKISQRLLEHSHLSPLGPAKKIVPEVRIGQSRLDFRVTDENGQDIYVEVKGCSLTKNGIALFPDAPTQRGRRHIEELENLIRSGVRGAVIILVVGPPADCFLPNSETDPDFTAVFWRAFDNGLEVYPVQYRYRKDAVSFIREIPICSEIRDRTLQHSKTL